MLGLREHLRGKRHILWDWNGTLLDDIELSVSTICGLLREHGLPEITVAQYRDRFCFPVINYYRSLGFNVEGEEFRRVGTAFIERYRSQAHECGLFAGAKELLAWVHASGSSQSILSAAEENHLHEITARHGIEEYLDHICGLSDHYASSKVDRGRKLINESGIDPRSTILVGDTDHDLEVGHALGVEVLLLGDGHQSYSRLKELSPRVLASRFSLATG